MPKILSDADISDFRDRLCDVAEKLFAAHGPDGVTMRQLASELGVSSMTPYRYFADKDAILAAVRARAFNRFAEVMEQAPATARSGAVEPGGAYLGFALGHPAAYKLMFDVNQPTFEAYPDLVAAMERARATMGLGLRGLAQEGLFTGDVELASHIFWSAMHGAVMLELTGFLPRKTIDARAILRPTLEALGKAMGLRAG